MLYIAGANRIGHGVDMDEKMLIPLLKHMATKNIPIEINLVSNEFILKVKDHRHPISLYKEFNVLLSVLTMMQEFWHKHATEQYVLLAKRYPEVNHCDIKKYVYNSIHLVLS
jgi:adenosine deaminase/adenosine deaminase CECR1